MPALQLTSTSTEAAAATAALSVCRLIYLPFALEFLFSPALFASLLVAVCNLFNCTCLPPGITVKRGR